MKFEKIKYPDGQISAKCIEPVGTYEGGIICERINTYEDLFYIIAIADIIRYNGWKGWELMIPCMFGQRSDRRFTEFQSFDLKLITDVINKCEFEKVTIFDPHSDICVDLIDKCRKMSPYDFVHGSIADIEEKNQVLGGYDGELLLVSPDAGAYKKVFEFGEKLKLPVMGAMKHRDSAGKIDLMFTHDVEGKDCLIVDDLCDGGYTFELLGKALKEHKARKVYLYVSHGIFSKGFDKLKEVIDHVYCTNSVKDITDDFVTQYKIV